MATTYHHCLASIKEWGGDVDDYLKIHAWFQEGRNLVFGHRYRALRHHAEGIFQCETIFGISLRLSTGRIIPTRWVAEQHVRNELGRIPTFADWAEAIQSEPWMETQLPLDVENDVAELANLPCSAAIN